MAAACKVLTLCICPCSAALVIKVQPLTRWYDRVSLSVSVAGSSCKDLPRCCAVLVLCPQAVSDLRAAGKSEKEVEKFSVLFKEVQQQIDSKQLRPFIRTQYMRTAFQV